MDKKMIERVVLEEKSRLAMFGMDKVCVDLVTRCLARIDAERGKEAVGFASKDMKSAVMKSATGKQPGTPHPHFIVPLFLSPTIPEGMALVPTEKPLPDLRLASYHEAIGWNACRDFMLAAAQGERNAD